MAELTAAATAEVYSPTPNGARSLHVWRTLLSWMGFVFQILLQILKGTPSLTQVLSFVGLRHSLLCPSPSPAFKPLPVDEPPPPPPSDHHVPKLTIVLDLDETLVCAYETSCLPDVVKSHAIEAGLKCFELECLSVEKDAEGKPKVSHVTVFERPGLREFLQKISEFADLVLFTAGLEVVGCTGLQLLAPSADYYVEEVPEQEFEYDATQEFGDYFLQFQQ